MHAGGQQAYQRILRKCGCRLKRKISASNTEHLLGQACFGAIRAWEGAAIYVETGRGFHSNPAEVRQDLAFRPWEVTVQMEVVASEMESADFDIKLDLKEREVSKNKDSYGPCTRSGTL